MVCGAVGAMLLIQAHRERSTRRAENEQTASMQ
jgi:hypothetical protein